MRMIFGLIFAVGLILAVGAVYLVKARIGQYQAALEAAWAAQDAAVDSVAIYAAAGPLNYGDVLEAEDVALVRWPVESLPEGVFREGELLRDGEDRPRHVLRRIEKGEPLMQVKLGAPGAGAGLTTALERGMRAFAVNVDLTSGVSDYLRLGDRVDIYWSGRVDSLDSGRGRDVTKLIASAVELIATGRDPDGSDLRIGANRTVTVSVTPEQVGALAQAQATGRLTLSLVGLNDDSASGPIEVDQNQLLGIEARGPIEAPAEPSVCYIRARRGAELAQIEVPCSN